MASILDRYGIKEVADVTFYKINDDGTPGKPVLFLDTLKVSTIEETAEQADARGGKGNPKLITWDYGKEITVNIEDALFSPKSMAIMLGDGTVSQGTGAYILKTCVIRMGETASNVTKAQKEYIVADVYDATEGSKRVKLYLGDAATAPAGQVLINGQLLFEATIDGTAQNSVLYDEDGTVIDDDFSESKLKALYQSGKSDSTGAYSGHKFMFTYWVQATTKTIVVSGDSFPGTYYIQGDTYSRSDVSGKDQFFQFIIPKAKMSAEQTITLEAEGDPATFNMNLTVLRPESGEMMKLVQYDLEQPSGG